MIKFSNYNVLAIINVIINLLSIIRFIRRFDEFKHKPIMHHAFIVLIVICFSTALSFFPESLVLKQYILYSYGLLYLSTVHLFHKEIIPFSFRNYENMGTVDTTCQRNVVFVSSK